MKPKTRQKERQRQQKGKETRTCYEVTKVKVEVYVPLFKKEHQQSYFSRKSTFLGEGYEGLVFKREGHQ